jgi:shikimate dehydrogenase
MTTLTRTYQVGLIGAGIGGSLSPALHEREAACLGLDYRYRVLDIEALGVGVGELLARARDAGYAGLNVTHPCKQTVIEHLDELSPEAEALGAVNTVVLRDGRAVGHNTDLTGFAGSFERGLADASLRSVLLIGAGGAGAAVAHALRAERLAILDTDTERAARLAAAVGAEVADEIDPSVDGIVNATPTGMVGHGGTPVPQALLRPHMWVADVVYRPLETQLLRDARAAGCRTLDGGGMVVLQAAGSLALFTERTPDPERMLRHFATLV